MIIIVSLLLQLVPDVTSADTITVQNIMYQVDSNKKLIVIIENANTINQRHINEKSGIMLDRYYRFNNPVGQIETGISYLAIHPDGTHYTIYFSQIPLVVINSPHAIVDEPRVFSEFTLIEPDGHVTHSYMGVEIRGGFSQTYPKLSLRLEFWEDSVGNITKDLSLLGMRNDDDWNLQAMYNEPLRFRSKTSNQLWKQIHTVYYQEKEPRAVNGIVMEYVELFLNGEYRGIYALSERIDRKQLQLKKYDGYIRGELYKAVNWGAPTFNSLPDYNTKDLYWDGFEYKFPEELVDWVYLYGLLDFVVNEDDYYFYSDYRRIIELNNAVDYFIFLNLLRATDNTGKNTFIARYDYEEPYFIVPWDLDGVFGTMYLGSRDPISTGLLSNGLYDRLIRDCQPEGFHETLKQRWNELRTDVITHQNIMALFQANFDLLTANGAYEREELAWEEYNFNRDDLNYLEDWLQARLSYLDEVFNSTCRPVHVSKPKEVRIKIYPNPVVDYMVVDVRGGVLPFEFSLYNSLGQLVTKKLLRNKKTSLHFTDLQSGMYFIVLQNINYRETKKIIVNQ
ncbi:MAG: CotH kinase family protein [Bacteroidota bacterium]